MTTTPLSITLLYGWLEIEADRQFEGTNNRRTAMLEALNRCALDGEPVLYAHFTDGSSGVLLEHGKRYIRYDHLEIVLADNVREKLMMRTFRLSSGNEQAVVSIIGGITGTSQPPDQLLASAPFGSDVRDGQLSLFG